MTYSFFNHPVTQARDLFEVGALVFVLGAGLMLWGYADWRKMKKWPQFVQSGSLRVTIVGCLFVSFAILWFCGAVHALRYGTP